MESESAAMPELPPEIIVNHILHCLPQKDLARFRCVSKAFRSIICRPEFDVPRDNNERLQELFKIALEEGYLFYPDSCGDVDSEDSMSFLSGDDGEYDNDFLV